MNSKLFLMLFLSGGLGAISRTSLSLYTQLPSLFVNVVGSFLIGISAAFFDKRFGGGDHVFHQVFAWGFLGAFTTFSAFSLEVLRFFQQGQIIKCLSYALLSVALGFAAVFIGYSTKKFF